jgi:hypothetical protein
MRPDRRVPALDPRRPILTGHQVAEEEAAATCLCGCTGGGHSLASRVEQNLQHPPRVRRHLRSASISVSLLDAAQHSQQHRQAHRPP